MRIATREHLNVVKCASKDSTRYIINSVLMEETKKGLRTVATDGRMMAVVESTGGFKPDEFPKLPAMETAPNTEKGAIVPSESVIKSLKAQPKNSRLPILNTCLVAFGKDQTTIASTDLQNANVMPTRNIDGQYPNWRQITDGLKGKPKFTISFNPKLLSEVLALAMANGSQCVDLDLWDEKSPMRIVGDKVIDGMEIKTTLVLMPMRSERKARS